MGGLSRVRVCEQSHSRVRSCAHKMRFFHDTCPPSPPGTHNLAVLNAGGQDGGQEEEYKNEAWSDARLTPLGREQASGLLPKMSQVKVEVALVSPLSRTMQTGELCLPSGVPFVANELLRERNGRHPCDRRRARSELEAEFPRVDFSALTAELDDSWTPEREPWAALVARASGFLRALAARPETHIAAVTHNDFLQALLFEAPDLRLADPALRRKFLNAEAMSVWVTWGVDVGGNAPGSPAGDLSPR